MADRPIIFSAPMVRALIEGRKTQTRRLLKLAGRAPEFIGPRGCQDDPTCWGWEDSNHGDFVTLEKEEGQRMGWRDWRGAYATGDRLWVRESFVRYHDLDETDMRVGPLKTAYRADGVFRWLDADTDTFHDTPPWKPSIHMPRWASRLTLTVTEVRVQRLQDISEADAIAEGVERLQVSTGQNRFSREVTGKWEGWFNAPTAQEVFANLWNSLHGPRAWDANPWVVALTFTVEQRNIDVRGA